MLSASVEQFLKHIAAEQEYSENTTVAYRNDLMQFVNFIDGNITAAQLGADSVQNYIEELQDQGYASSTVARKVAAIKTFLGYLHHTGTLNRDIARQIETPKVQRQVTQLLTRQQVNKLLAVPAGSNNPKNLRNQVLLDLLYYTNLRINEMVELTVDSYDGKKLHISLSDGNRREINLNKTSIGHLDAYLKTLDAYLKTGRPALEKGSGEKALFLNHRGQSLTRQGLWLIIKMCAEQAGLPGTVTPHILRRSFDLHQQEQSSSR
jgi:integrase/recombinase XerD